MSTQRHIGINPTSFIAAVDFSACPTTLYRFARAGSVAGEVALANGASNPGVLGILQDSPSAAQGAALVLLGTTKLVGRVATCDLGYGKYLKSASDGFAETSTNTTGEPVVAMWLGPNVTTAGASIIGDAIFYGLTACNVAQK